MFRDGAQRQHREERQSRKDVHDKYQDNGKRRGIGEQSTNRVIDKTLFHQRSGNGKLNDDG